MNDESEANAIAEILTKNRRDPLLVGSIKSNVGLAGEAAGFLSVMKALFVLDTGEVIPNINLSECNDEVQAFKQKRLQVISILMIRNM